MVLSIYADRPWVKPWTSQNTDVEVLQNELRQLQDRDDEAALLRRFDLHVSLAWLVHEMGTTRGQAQAEQALAIARRLNDRLREADALHALATVYLGEHADSTAPDEHPTQEKSRTAQRLHEQALQIRTEVLGPNHLEVARSLLYILSAGRLWGPFAPYVPLAERVVQIYERALGSDHPLTTTARDHLALVQRLAKQLR